MKWSHPKMRLHCKKDFMKSWNLTIRQRSCHHSFILEASLRAALWSFLKNISLCLFLCSLHEQGHICGVSALSLVCYGVNWPVFTPNHFYILIQAFCLCVFNVSFSLNLWCESVVEANFHVFMLKINWRWYFVPGLSVLCAILSRVFPPGRVRTLLLPLCPPSFQRILYCCTYQTVPSIVESGGVSIAPAVYWLLLHRTVWPRTWSSRPGPHHRLVPEGVVWSQLGCRWAGWWDRRESKDVHDAVGGQPLLLAANKGKPRLGCVSLEQQTAQRRERGTGSRLHLLCCLCSSRSPCG